MRAHEGSRQGVFLGFNTFTNVKSGFNEAVSSSSISISTAENVSNEAKNGILPHKKLHLDQPLSTLASGAHTSPKKVQLDTVIAIGLMLTLFSPLTSLSFPADF